MTDDIEKEKWTLQREEEKHLNPPVKVGTGLFFVSQLSAPFRCMLRAIGSVVNRFCQRALICGYLRMIRLNQLKVEEPPVTPENRSQVVLIKDIKCIPVKLFANYTNIFWYLKLNSACYKHEDLNFGIKFVDLLVPSRRCGIFDSMMNRIKKIWIKGAPRIDEFKLLRDSHNHVTSTWNQ